jgi:hypothetical protein
LKTSRLYKQENKDKPTEKNTNKRHELSAVRIRLSEQVIKEFENPIKRQAEIKKSFPNKNLVIKFAEFAKFDPKILLIATDDQETHELLSDPNKWPKTAFNRGIQIKTKGSAPPTGNSHGGRATPQTFSFSIRMTREIEIEDSKVQEDFKELGFFTAIRTIKKLDSSPSAFVRLATTHKELYEEHVYKRKPLCLFYQRFYAVQEIKPRQCWNCQGLGHLAFDCPKNEPTCMQCGDSHRVKECSNIDKENKTASKIFCSNCNQEGHTASARACPILKTHVKALIIEQKNKSHRSNQIELNNSKKNLCNNNEKICNPKHSTQSSGKRRNSRTQTNSVRPCKTSQITTGTRTQPNNNHRNPTKNHECIDNRTEFSK